MPDPTPQQVLDTPVAGGCGGTVRDCLMAALSELWQDREPPRGWRGDVAAALVKAGYARAGGDIDRLVLAAIDAIAAEKIHADISIRNAVAALMTLARTANHGPPGIGPLETK